MLKNSSSSRHFVATVAALLGVCSPSLPLYAQENSPTTLQLVPSSSSPSADVKRLEGLAPGTDTQLLIRVRNIKASAVAYWLDPTHHQAPIDLKVAQSLGTEEAFRDLTRFPGNGNGPLGLKLPKGVTELDVIEPQNAIIAYGTKEGLQALSNLIPTIDVPLVQYEVEAQFLQIPRSRLAAAGLKFNTPAQKDPYYFGAVTLVPSNIRILNILKEKDVKVLTAPRVTAIDGLTGQLQQVTHTPFTMNLGPIVVPFNAALTPAKEPTESLQSVAFVSTTIGFKTTPHQNKNELVSLSITPILGTRTVSVAATVHDGQPFAIQMSPANEDKQVIVIVTPRRIRRVGDDDAK